MITIDGVSDDVFEAATSLSNASSRATYNAMVAGNTEHSDIEAHIGAHEALICATASVLGAAVLRDIADAVQAERARCKAEVDAPTTEDQLKEFRAIGAVAVVVERLLVLRDFAVSIEPGCDEHFAINLCSALGGTDHAANIDHLSSSAIVVPFLSACTGGCPTREGSEALSRYILNGIDHADLCAAWLAPFSQYLICRAELFAAVIDARKACAETRAVLDPAVVALADAQDVHRAASGAYSRAYDDLQAALHAMAAEPVG
jgi:hypothetical protein